MASPEESPQPHQQSSPETTDNQKKPFTLFLVTHSEDRTAQLAEFAAKAREVLEANPGKRVLLFTEDAGGDCMESKRTTELVLSGVKPSEASDRAEIEGIEAFLNQVAARPELYPSVNIDEWRAQLEEDRKKPIQQRGFMKVSNDIIDQLAEEYPGRIVWAREWLSQKGYNLHAEQIADKTNKKKIVKRILGIESKSSLKDSLTVDAMFDKQREEDFAQYISEMLKNDPEIAEAIGWMGASHTPLSHEMRRRGHKVAREFPGRDGQTLYYSPQLSVIRAIRLGKEVTKEEIALARQAQHDVLAVYGIPLVLDHTIKSLFGRGLFYDAEGEKSKEQELYAKAQRLFKKRRDRYEARKKHKKTGLGRQGPGTPRHDFEPDSAAVSQSAQKIELPFTPTDSKAECEQLVFGAGREHEPAEEQQVVINDNLGLDFDDGNGDVVTLNEEMNEFPDDYGLER